MSFRSAVLAGCAALGFAFASIPVQAQNAVPPNANAQQPAAAPRSAEDNWLKVCSPLPDGQKACLMRQIVLASTGQFLGSFVLRIDPSQESRLLAVAAVPLGVMLPFKMRWQIDNGKPIEIHYILCDPNGCQTQLVINEAYVNSLKKGSTLKLIAKTRQGEDLVVDINLAGFTSVYESDTALSFDEFRESSSGASQLEQTLQDRAEQLRRQKEAGEAGTPPAP